MKDFTALIVGAAGAVLVTGGIVKFVDRENFLQVLEANRSAHSSYIFLATTVPIAEVVVAALLFLGVRSQLDRRSRP
jgi:uncharacterized membrane protein YphA (DoxX/SURF4 family)